MMLSEAATTTDSFLRANPDVATCEQYVATYLGVGRHDVLKSIARTDPRRPCPVHLWRVHVVPRAEAPRESARRTPLIFRQYPRRRRSASHTRWHATWNRIAARLSLYTGSYSVKRMDCPHTAHGRPLPRQIQIFAGERKHTCIDLLSHEVGLRFRHWVLPGGHENSPSRPRPRCSSLLHGEAAS
jgi:hypothetical protein